LRIWGPVKRSVAGDPVRRRVASGPPNAASISRHWRVVVASSHTGAWRRENIIRSCGASGAAASSVASVAGAVAFR
jgi:hypothetical protein